MRGTEPRRFLIAAGTRVYEHDFVELPSVPEDVRRIVALLGSPKYGGYQQVLAEVSDDPAADAYRKRVRQWLQSPERDPRDLVVFYYSAHGYFNAAGQYLLAARNTDPLDTDTSIPAAFFVQALEASCVGHVLVIIDACFAGAAIGVELATLTLNLARGRASDGTPEIAVLTAARREVAVEGAFSRALENALDISAAEVGERQQYIPIDAIVGKVNELLPQYGPQRALLGFPGPGISGPPPFIANPKFKPNLPGAVDLETQLRLNEADLLAHWGPRARGVETDLQRGWHFSGRHRALKTLIAWMGGNAADGPMFVTGAPGSGKSAILARLVTLSDPLYRQRMPPAARDPGLEPPLGLIEAAVHCRGKTVDDVRRELCAALAVSAQDAMELAQAVREARKEPVVVFDALDEALEPDAILWLLIYGLAEAGARVVVGVRTAALELARDAQMIDLDDREYVAVDDIADYAFCLLSADPAPGSPYADQTVARQTAALIAARAKPSFLVARMAAAAIIHRDEHLTEGDWQLTAGRAFDEYLSRFGSDEQRVRDLLSALAFGEGQGVPKGQVWLKLAYANCGRAYRAADLDFVLAVAKSYIVEDVEQGLSVYRLYHQALADHLKQDIDDRDIHAAITSSLISLVTGGSDGAARGWIDAPPYVRRHLPAHAARGGRLANLLEDPGFLLSVDPDRLLSATSSHLTADAKLIADCYRGVVHQLRDRNPLEAASTLEFAAHLDGVTRLVAGIARLPWPRSWDTAWAVWEPRSPHRVIGQGSMEIVGPVLTRSADGLIVFATDYANRVVSWDLANERPSKQQGMRLGVEGVATVMATAPGNALPGVAIGDQAGNLFYWNPITGRASGVANGAHDGPIMSVGFCAFTGKSIIASCGLDGALRLWDAASLARWGDPLVEHPAWLAAIAASSNGDSPPAMHFPIDVAGVVGRKWVNLRGHAGDVKAYVMELDGTRCGSTSLATNGDDWFCSTIANGGVLDRLLITGSFDGRIRIWDLATGQPVGIDMTMDGDAVTVLSLRVDEMAHLLASGGVNGSVYLWDLATRTRMGVYASERGSAVTSLSISRLDDTLLVVAGFEDGTVQVWKNMTHVARLAGHEGSVSGVAAASAGGKTVVVSGGGASIYLWPVTEDTTRGPGVTERFWPRLAHALTIGGSARKWVAVGTPSGLYLIDHASGEVQPPLLKTMSVDAAAFGCHDGRDIVAACDWRDGVLRCVDVQTGRPVLGSASRLISKHWIPIDLREVAGRLYCLAVDGEGSLCLIDIENTAPVGPAVAVDWGHRTDRWDAWLFEAAGDLRSVILDRKSGALMVYDMGSGVCVHRFQTKAGFATAAATGIFRGRPILVSSAPEQHHIQAWDLESGDSIACWNADVGLVSAISVGEIDHALAIACHEIADTRGCLRVWRETEAREIFRLDLNLNVYALAFSESLMLVASEKGVVALRVHPVAEAPGTRAIAEHPC